MKIAKARYKLWEGFHLTLEEDLDLRFGACYHLKGENGSGKSSFIKRILIPKLQESGGDHYILYLEQQIRLQAYALKANASLEDYAGSLNSERDYMIYLLYNLEQAMKQERRKLVVLADEFRHFPDLMERLKVYETDMLIVYTSHQEAAMISACELLVSLVNEREAVLCEKQS